MPPPGRSRAPWASERAATARRLQLYVADDALEPFVDAVPILEKYPGLAFSRAALPGYEGLTIRLPGAKAGAG